MFIKDICFHRVDSGGGVSPAEAENHNARHTKTSAVFNDLSQEIEWAGGFRRPVVDIVSEFQTLANGFAGDQKKLFNNSVLEKNTHNEAVVDLLNGLLPQENKIHL